MRTLPIALCLLSAVVLAGCGVRSGNLEQPKIPEIQRYVDRDVRNLSAALEQNRHVTQEVGRLSFRMRWLKTRWQVKRIQEGRPIDPELVAKVEDVSDRMYRWSRAMGTPQTDGSPPKLSGSALATIGKLRDQAQGLIEKMRAEMKADGTL